MADAKCLAVMPAILTTPSQQSGAAERRKQRQLKQAEKKKTERAAKKEHQDPPSTSSTDRKLSIAPSTDSRSSLTGWHLARTAFNVTRRLSMSAYMVSLLDEGKEPSEHSIKIAPLNANYEPTYRMAPNEDETFSGSMVKEIVDRILAISLVGRKYNAKEGPRLSCSIANMVTARLKDLNMPRYKVVCNIIIGQKQSQSIQMVSRCIWNPNTDTFVNTSYENGEMYAVASVHGVYLD